MERPLYLINGWFWEGTHQHQGVIDARNLSALEQAGHSNGVHVRKLRQADEEYGAYDGRKVIRMTVPEGYVLVDISSADPGVMDQFWADFNRNKERENSRNKTQ